MRERVEKVRIGLLMPKKLDLAIERIVQLDLHADKTEFIVEACRRYLEETAQKLGIPLAELLAWGEQNT